MSRQRRQPYGLRQTEEQRLSEKLRNLDLDKPMARPRHYAMACERCVFGTGEHREDCAEVAEALHGVDQMLDRWNEEPLRA